MQAFRTQPTEVRPAIHQLLEGTKNEPTISDRRASGVNLRGHVSEAILRDGEDREHNLRKQYSLLSEERQYSIQKIAELRGYGALQALEDEVERLQEQITRMKDVVKYMEREKERERVKLGGVRDEIDVPDVNMEGASDPWKYQVLNKKTRI